MLKKFIFLILPCLMSILLQGCKEDPEMPNLYFVYTIDMGGNVSLGENLEVESLSLDTDKSSKGIHITSATYYLDDEEIGSSSTSPFAISYKIEDIKPGEHTLKIIAHTNGTDDYYACNTTITIPIYVYEESVEESLAVSEYFGDGVTKSDSERLTIYVTGNTLSGYVDFTYDNASLLRKIKSIKCYWDGDLVCSDTHSPFEFSVDVSNEAKGEHSFYIEIELHTEYTDWTASGEYKVILQ